MRRILLLVLIGIAVPALFLAQRARLDRIRRAVVGEDAIEIGLIGGPNRTTATALDSIQAGYRASAGGYLSIPVMGRYRFRPEVLVTGTRVGYTLSYQTPCQPPGPCPPAYQAEAVSTTWLEVPLLVEARFPHAFGRHLTPRLQAGPFVGVRLQCSIAAGEALIGVVPNGVTDPQTNRECDGSVGTESYHNGVAGFVLGGSVGFRGLGLGARWTRSLVPIAPSRGGLNSSRVAGGKLSTLSVTLEIGTRLN